MMALPAAIRAILLPWWSNWATLLANALEEALLTGEPVAVKLQGQEVMLSAEAIQALAEEALQQIETLSQKSQP